jgi:hypothetical protein
MQAYLGWNRDDAARARTAMLASRRFFTVAAPSKPPRPAVSLGHLRLRTIEQGAAGTCWVMSPVMLFEITAKARGYAAFPACRRLVGFAAKAMYEGGDNMAGGGSPTDAVRVMTVQGVGIAHERLDPYPVINDENAMARALAEPPPDSVYRDAKATHLLAPVDVRSLDQVISLIDTMSIPTANGYACPKAMQDDPSPFLAAPGPQLGGHSQLIIGYALPGILDNSKYRWFQLDNWWGELYQPLPQSLAKQVDGYEPSSKTRDTSKWVREDAYLYYCRLEGGCEHVSATDIDGLAKGITVAAADFSDAFSII